MTQTNPFNLEDRLILITGASSGIGRQCAVSCSKAGALVVITGRDKTRLEETLGLMEDSGKHLSYSIDLLDYGCIIDLVKDIVLKKGRISGLINCAGISTTLPLNAISTEKMELFFRTNVFGSVNLTKQVIKMANFSEAGGSIIFISSVMGAAGESGKSLYSMTKGAINSLVRSLAIEMAPRKIRFNSISPGVVESPMSKKSAYSRDDISLSRIMSMHPLGLGQPTDVANACIFLLSDAARWITGTNLIIDGGYLAK